jgi:hypothetical protein
MAMFMTKSSEISKIFIAAEIGTAGTRVAQSSASLSLIPGVVPASGLPGLWG